MYPIASLLISLALVASPALSVASQLLAQQKNCLSCHAAATRVVGPSFKEIAAKYASQDDAVAQLSERIIKGGTGRWGFVPMPPNAQVSPDEAKALTGWILQQK